MEIEKRNYNVMDYIKIPFKNSPIAVTFIILLKIFISLIPSLQVLATASFVDTAISIFKNGYMSRIYIPLFSIIFLLIITWVASLSLSFINLKFNLKMNEVIDTAVVKKRSRLHYEHIENNDTWDLITRVGEETSGQIINGLNNVLSIVEYGVKIGSLIFIIITKVWWVAVVIMAISIPLFKLAIRSGKINYEAFEDSQKYRRKANYLKEVLSSRKNVEERALFGYTTAINKRWAYEYEIARKIDYKAEKYIFIKMKLGSIITAVLSIFIAVVLLYPVSNSKLSVGMYMSLVTAAFSLVQQMSWEFAVVMKDFAKNKIYLKDFTKFSSLKEVKGADTLPDLKIQQIPLKSIEFRNVSFAYPGTDRMVLDRLSMYLECDKQYAFVGKNGAGKTTITKLLTGLYDNYEGEILINNKSLREFSQEELKAYFSIVYQDFAKYHISLRDNIILGNCREIIQEDKRNILIKNVLSKLEITRVVEELPHGIDTHLGKLSEGSVDLSGGQWQRVAIARTIFSNAPIYILDEPTAALDPISESNLYKMFREISKGKSTFLITHRLGAARIADEILVIEDGRVVEKGSHKELVNKKGIYAEMFEMQRSWYDEKAQ